MKAPTPEQARAFQALYDHFNKALFAGSLAPVLLNFSRQAGAYGFFAPERWVAGPDARHEISLNPSYLAERAPREIASTLVHEMVHAWQYEHGTPSRSGYHNHEWAAKMERVGLMPSSTGAPGGRRVGQRMTHYVIEGGAFDRAFAKLPKGAWFPWVCGEAEGEGTVRRKRSLLSKTKYTCGCGVNVWGKPGLHLVCGECESVFLEAG
ncbi:MAG: SprT-like domain-containing protein [Sandaracinaceae bacterium]|nr:SprT-like domain-containing protein [Sandaracinaceae bacterium]